MRILLIYILIIFFCEPGESQNNKSFKINSISQDSGDLVYSTFKYPSFISGKVLFKNQHETIAALNYNYLSGQIVFQNQTGEAMELAKPETVRYIAIGQDTFYYVDKSYVELITHYPTVNLAGDKIIKFNGKEKKGAYGTYSGTAASTAIDDVTDAGINKKIGVDENVMYSTSAKYYLADKTNNFIIASKKNFYKAFFNQEDELSEYLKNNTVHFNQEEDLIKLLEYLQGK